MNLLSGSLIFIAMAVVSCAPQYARMTHYQVNEPYSFAKQKLIDFHQSQKRSFSLLHDEVSTQMMETKPGSETIFITKQWAFDIGTTPQYRVALKAQGQDSLVEAKELPSPRAIYDGTRALSGSKLGNLATLDQWIQKNMEVKSRTVGEDRENPPIYPPQ